MAAADIEIATGLRRRTLRCAIYTRKSTEEGLQQEFNSLDAQREAGEAFIVSQKSEGWQVIADSFDDGGCTGANMDRPALKRLLAAAEARAVDCIVVYKVDRLSRSLTDFARIVEVLDQNSVSFVSVPAYCAGSVSMLSLPNWAAWRNLRTRISSRSALSTATDRRTIFIFVLTCSYLVWR